MAARTRRDSVWGAVPDTIWGFDSTWGLADTNWGGVDSSWGVDSGWNAESRTPRRHPIG
ncbi:hypothetical protein [Streptomyces sp. CBMA156]|uniref:hypothetical protein n=1 Tax=Streptomyces sp. CBMA156 TaxID=1930280 RepID=UPI001661D3B3|nr:hypothetical protein [Streptomyces sp. CBMA156]